MTLRPAGRVAGLERTLIRQIFDAAPADAINLGLGQPDLPTPEIASLAGVRAIADGRTGYTSTAGDPELRRALAGVHGPFAEGADSVLVTIGSQQAMFVSCLALAEPGREILYPDPGYPGYAGIARLVGAEGRTYPLRAERGFRLDPADVEAGLTSRTAAVILCAPSNPTGACMVPADLRDLVELLERRGIPWISDEIYSAFVYDEPFVSPASFSRAGLVVSSLSKELSMTGWRVGWVVGPPPFMARLIAAHQYMVTCACSISQRAALAAFTAGGRTARGRYVEIFRRRRDVMREALAEIPGLEIQAPDGAFYFFVDLSRHGDTRELCRRILQRQNVVTIPGEAFGPAGAGFVRISFAASEETIREGIGRIAAELARGAQ